MSVDFCISKLTFSSSFFLSFPISLLLYSHHVDSPISHSYWDLLMQNGETIGQERKAKSEGKLMKKSSSLRFFLLLVRIIGRPAVNSLD